MQFLTAMPSQSGGQPNNQDFCAFLVRGGYGCYVMADGLGGHLGGEMAARNAGESILEAFCNSPGASTGHLNVCLKCPAGPRG